MSCLVDLVLDVVRTSLLGISLPTPVASIGWVVT